MNCRQAHLALVVLAVSAGSLMCSARADVLGAYELTGTFALPAASPFDALPDGRLVTLHGTDLYAETSAGSRVFDRVGTLAGMDVGSYGAAFVRVSPDGTHLAVGNNGGSSYANYQVGVFDLGNLAGTWFPVAHFDAAWTDNSQLALSAAAGASSKVTVLDTASSPTSPHNPTVVSNIAGASAGITFDAAGNLFTGNGYASGAGSSTGTIKAFSASSWMAALSGGQPADFEAGGTMIGRILSATSLGFDAEGNLHVGGGDFGSGAFGYAGLADYSAVQRALAGGSPIGSGEVQHFDPDLTNPYNFYDVNYSHVTGELYVREGASVWTYAVPEPAAGLLLLALGVLVRRPRMAGNGAGEVHPCVRN